MRSILGRNLNMCFSKMMRRLTPESPPMSLHSTSSPEHHTSSSSSSSSSSILMNTFNSLYDHTFDSNEPEPADLATAFASQRFFFSSPGHSNSIVQSSSPSSSSPVRSHKKRLLLTNSVAVPTYSPDPYMDFRRSMQEMVEARPELRDVNANWEMLQELLLCYLALNPHTTHKFILGAFADLLLSLMSSAAAGC